MLARWCTRFSPYVAPWPETDERAGSSGLTLDITACDHLFGGEAAMLHAVIASLARLGFTGRGAIAGSIGAAHALAKFGPPHARPGAPPSLFMLESVEGLFNDVQGADAAPTAAVKAAGADLQTKLGPLENAWSELLGSDLRLLNEQLTQAGFPEIKPRG